MKQTQRIFNNAGMAVLQILVTGLVLFFLYSFLLESLGVELLGVWSLVLATSSIIHIGNLGLSGSVVKFVAKYVARQEMVFAAEVVETSAISLGGVFFVLLVIAYPALSKLLEAGLPSDHLSDALTLLPFALVSLWITVVTGTFQGGLDGCQRIDLRSVIAITGSILYLAFAVIFVQAYGFIGLGYAQVLQAVFLLIASWIVLRWELRDLSYIPYRWRRGIFMEILRYGVSFQVSSIAIMLCEPATKWMMSYFGGLAMTGYYEMASRMVTQFRAIPVAANQVLVPVIASMEETDADKSSFMYMKAFRFILFFSLPYYAAIIVAIPLVSHLWIGTYEAHFVGFSMLLVVGALFGTLVVPAYFSYLGKGRLRWTMTAHIVIAVLNIGLGALLGMLYGGIGVAMGAVLAIIIGNIILITAYHIEEDILWRDIRMIQNIWLLAASLVGMVSGLLIYFYFQSYGSMLEIAVLMLLAFMFCVLPAIWLHPFMRILVVKWSNKS